MPWQVVLTKKAAKQAEKIPQREKHVLRTLIGDLALCGPVVPHWKNYSPLGKETFHCHLGYKWVACWRVEDRKIQVIKIYYVGSRENAPY